MPQLDSVMMDVGKHAGGWLLAPDGVRLYYREWVPEPAHAVVLYLHGIEGHSDWFSATAASLQRSGIAVYALDRRGAGRSEGHRGHLPGCRALLDDVRAALTMIRQRHPMLPAFLFGNCWGAKAAVIAAARDEDGLLSGLILSSPAIAVKVDVPLSEKIAIVAAFLTGNLRPFAIPLTASMFTDNPEYVRYIENDSIKLTEATAGFFVNSVILTVLARRALRRLRLPVLVVQAGHDAIVDVEFIKRSLPTVAARDATLEVFEDCHHSLDFDRDSGRYCRLVGDWILAHCPESSEVRS